jgi:hypothetical protein
MVRMYSSLSPTVQSRRAARILLWADRGLPLSTVAHAFRVSRPTVYRYLWLWLRFRDVALLDARAAALVAPWRRRPRAKRPRPV